MDDAEFDALMERWQERQRQQAPRDLWGAKMSRVPQAYAATDVESSSERAEREQIARVVGEDVDKFLADGRVVAVALVAFRRDGRLGQTVSVVSSSDDAPSLTDFGVRIDNALRIQFPRKSA